MGASLALGRELVNADAERTRVTSAQLEVITAREDFRSLESDAWFAAAKDDPGGTGLPTEWLLRAVSISGRITTLAQEAGAISPEAAAAAAEGAPAARRRGAGHAHPHRARHRRSGRRGHPDPDTIAEFNRAVDTWVAAYGRQLARIDADTRAFTTRMLTVFTLSVALLCLIGAVGWFALNRARSGVVAEMERTVAEQAALRRTATEIATLADTRAIMDALAREVAGLFGAARASVVRIGPGPQARIVGSSVEGEQWGMPLDPDGADGISAVLRTERPRWLPTTPPMTTPRAGGWSRWASAPPSRRPSAWTAPCGARWSRARASRACSTPRTARASNGSPTSPASP